MRFNQGQASSAAEVTRVEGRQTASYVFGFPSQNASTLPQIHYFGPDFLFEPIPESSTALLMGIGLAAISVRRRA